MANFTRDQFMKAVTDNGFSEANFSTADWQNAMEDPDFGMTILNTKIDWKNAKDAEGRWLSNQQAEAARGTKGYTGGADGGKFYLTLPSPNDFQKTEAPTWGDTYGDTYKNALDGVMNFQYDPSTDPLYSQYRKQYTREGRRATEDTLGSLAASSGGIPSSYAATAAAQAGNYYRAQMTDKIPELEQLQYNQQLNALNSARNARQDDFNIYLNALDQYNNDRNFDYGVHSDEIADRRYLRNEAWQNAMNAAQYGGDYSWLQKLGVNTGNNPEDFERRYNLALLAAQYGDLSGLKALGINPDAMGLYNFNSVSSKGYAGSGRSGGGSGGYSGSGESYGGSAGIGGPAGYSGESGTGGGGSAGNGGNGLTDALWNAALNSVGIAKYGLGKKNSGTTDWESKYR